MFSFILWWQVYDIVWLCVIWLSATVGFGREHFSSQTRIWDPTALLLPRLLSLGSLAPCDRQWLKLYSKWLEVLSHWCCNLLYGCGAKSRELGASQFFFGTDYPVFGCACLTVAGAWLCTATAAKEGRCAEECLINAVTEWSIYITMYIYIVYIYTCNYM